MKEFWKKTKKSVIILFCLFMITGFWLFLFILNFNSGKTVYGVTFSKEYAGQLGLDWQKTYSAILDDLKVSNLRLVAYWDEIEAKQDIFDFTDLDWQLQQARDRNIEVILVVGRRTPRWPECHDPAWLSPLAPLAIKQQQLEFIKTVVNRYKDNPAIYAWQVENEPFLTVFGECPLPDKQFLIQEVSLVKSLDQKPIIITDSGELGWWQSAASLGDILGSTMYRIVWNENLGFWDYFFIPPAFYHYKAELTKFFHPNLKKVIITELQMEPWTFNRQMTDLTWTEQEQSFSLKRFQDNIIYVKKTGFPEVYLWGAEYWYWLINQGHPEIWQQAKMLWQ